MCVCMFRSRDRRKKQMAMDEEQTAMKKHQMLYMLAKYIIFFPPSACSMHARLPVLCGLYSVCTVGTCCERSHILCASYRLNVVICSVHTMRALERLTNHHHQQQRKKIVPATNVQCNPKENFCSKLYGWQCTRITTVCESIVKKIIKWVSGSAAQTMWITCDPFSVKWSLHYRFADEKCLGSTADKGAEDDAVALI